jgi:acylphosphatase
MKKSVRVYISGTVQGMFFRNFIKENAEKIGVNGFVRNLEDGRVEVFIEGDTESVSKMIGICEKGQRDSEIQNVEVKPEKHQGFRNFKILHI